MDTPIASTSFGTGADWVSSALGHARAHAFSAAGLGLGMLAVIALLWQSAAQIVAGEAPAGLRHALIGVGLASGMSVAYPVGLGLAAGAMIFVVSHEVIPETHRNGHQTPATLGLMAGFALMMVLDTTLG